MKEAKRVKGKQTVHYKRLKSYHILNKEAKINLHCQYMRIKHKSRAIFIFEELFNVIYEVHIVIAYGGRNLND